MASTNKVKILCRHGGNFICESNKVYYKGGKNLIVHVDRDINYFNLSNKVHEKCKLTDITSIQYQYPGLDLDSLVSIEDDDDVSNMMMEFSQSNMVIELFVSGDQNLSTLAATTSEPVVHGPKDLDGRNGNDVLFRLAFESNTGDVQNIQNDSQEMECNDVDALQNLDDGTNGAALMDFDEGRNTGMSFPDSSNLNKGNGFQDNRLNSNNAAMGVAPEDLNGNKETSIHITTLDTGDVRSIPNKLNQKDCNEMDNAVTLPCLNVDRGANDIKEGQEFENESAFRKALRNHAIRSNFEYKRTRSGHGVFRARCCKDGCSWSMSACETPGKHTFKVKTLKGNHTCNKSERIRKNKHANEKWIADLVTDQKIVHRNPNDIVDAIDKEYGIEVSYHKARRGKLLAAERDADLEQSIAGRKTLSGKRLAAERDADFEQSISGRKTLRGKRLAAERDADSEQSIEIVLKGIERTNPGSKTKLSRSLDKSMRIFVAYKASICGFLHGCRPLLILDYKKIEKYAIVCLYASSVDANDDTFPVAYAFVESKGKENWKWFCEELAHILVSEDKIPEMTFMLDPKERILEEVVRDVFPDSRHRYHLERLLGYILEKFGSPEIVILICVASWASTQNEFDAKLSVLRDKSEEAWKFIKGMEPNHWAVSHYQGNCRSRRSRFLLDAWKSTLELYFNWSEGTKDLHIVSFLKNFHVLIMETLSERLEESSNWTSVLAPRIEHCLSEEGSLSKIHYVSSCATTATEFVVSSCQGITEKEAVVVNLQLRTCSCYCWQGDGFPCKHAIAAIRHEGGNLYDYCDEWVTAAKYRKTYSQQIYPLPDDII